MTVSHWHNIWVAQWKFHSLKSLGGTSHFLYFPFIWAVGKVSDILGAHGSREHWSIFGMTTFMHYSYHIMYKANKYKAVYIIHIFLLLFLSSLFSICHFLLASINYLPAKAYGHSVKLFVMLQLLILLWFWGWGDVRRMPCFSILNSILDPIFHFDRSDRTFPLCLNCMRKNLLQKYTNILMLW